MAQHVRALTHESDARAAEGVLVLEGTKSIGEVIAEAPSSIRCVVATQDWIGRHEDILKGLVPLVCSPAAFQRLTGTVSPQSVLAVVAQPRWDEAAVLAGPSHLRVYGEELQDPANLGPLLRIATALGADGVWLSPGSADPYHPKVVRASAGSILRIPVFPGTTLPRLLHYPTVLYAADSHQAGAVPLTNITSRPARLTLALGNEGRGLSAALLGQVTIRFFIPLQACVESLNVTTAAAISLYHLRSLPLSPSNPTAN